MCSRLPALVLASLVAAGCGGEEGASGLAAAVASVEPACGDNAAATPVVIRGAVPVRPTASLAGAGASRVDATYRAWLGPHALAEVLWFDPATLTAAVPPGLPAGDYPLTVEGPSGARATLDAAFRVQVGPCAPAGPALVTQAEVRPGAVTVGQQATVRAVVTNVGLSPALGVTGTVAARLGSLQLLEASAGPVDLAPGASAELTWTYAALAPSPAGGHAFDVDVAGSDAAGARVAAARARSNALLVSPPATLSASGAAPARLSVGQPFTFSLTVTNSGAAPALVTPGLAIAAPAAATLLAAPAPRSIPALAQERFDFALRAAAAGEVALTGTVAATDENSGLALDVAPAAPAIVEVQRPPALATAVAAAPVAVASGGTVAVTASVRNDGEAAADRVEATVAAAPPGFVLVAGPAGPQAVPGGASRAFSWTYRAGPGASAGPFAVDAAGADANGGAPATAPRAESATVAAAYRVGGNVSGLTGGEVTLRLAGAGDLVVDGNRAFAFAPLVPSGAAFAVSVAAQPASPSQVCDVAGGTGTVGTGDVSTVTVNCRTNRFTLGGTVSGLAGSGLVLREAGSGQEAALTSSGTWAFPAPLPSGASYAVSVAAEPAGPSQACAVAGGSGVVGGADVSSVAVTCATRSFTVGGTISGLTASGLVLRNGPDELRPPAGATAFSFPTPVPSGASYAVTAASPPGQTCAVVGGTGTVGSGDVSSVAVGCSTLVYALSTSVVGKGSLRCGGGACLPSYPWSTAPMAIEALPAVGWRLAGWSGDCAGAGDCAVVMTQSRAVGAAFERIPLSLAVDVAGPGAGTVRCDGGACPTTVLYGEVLTLAAEPAPGSAFDGWSGDCAGLAPCSLVMVADRAVTATFSPAPSP